MLTARISLTLVISTYQSSLLVSPLNGIHYPHRADEHSFLETKQLLTLQVRVDLGVMVMENSTSLKFQNWSLTIRWFSVISRTPRGVGVLPLRRDAVRFFFFLQPQTTGLLVQYGFSASSNKAVWYSLFS